MYRTKSTGGVRAAERGVRLAPLLLLLACVFCHAARAQTPTASEGATLRLNVTVTNSRGEFVMGLNTKDFGVMLGERPHEVAYAETRDVPASVGLLLDSSGSFINNPWGVDGRGVRAAVARFVGLGHRSNDYFVATIGTRPELLADWSRADGLDLARVGTNEMKGLTPLYDSVLTALEKLKEGGNRKRVLIVVSDGDDTASEHDLQATLKALRAVDVVVYTVGVFRGPGGFVSEDRARAALEDMAAATGGKFFSPGNRKEFDAAFDAIAVELRHQYEVGVRLGDGPSPQKPLAVKVKVNSPADRQDLKSLRVRTRKAYVAGS